MAGDEMLKMALDELDNLISANTIMGDAIDAGDKTIIPVASFGFGFGAGEGGDKDNVGGAGTGAGGGVSPVAIIVIHKDVRGPEGVQVLSLKKASGISEIITTVGDRVLPQIIGAVKSYGSEKKEESEKEAEDTGAEIPLTEE